MEKAVLPNVGLRLLGVTKAQLNIYHASLHSVTKLSLYKFGQGSEAWLLIY